MKKKSIFIIIGGILLVAVITLIVSYFYFPIRENELTENALAFISGINEAEIAHFIIYDSNFCNNSAAFILRTELATGEVKYYAFSYCKHLLLPRYRRTFYTDYANPDFSGILISTGLPYETVYDISHYALEYKDSTLNYDLVIILICSVEFIILICIFGVVRVYVK